MRKFLPYILILIVLVGLFSPSGKVNAMAAKFFCDAAAGHGGTPSGQGCYDAVSACTASGPIDTNYSSAFRKCTNTYKPPANQPAPAAPTNPLYKACVNITTNSPADCALKFPDTAVYLACMAAGGKTPNECQDASITAAKLAVTAAPQTDFEKAMASRACVSWRGADIPWCFVIVSNLIFHTVPAFYLAKTAYFFNVLISVTLSGDVFKQAFVPQAWAIVRDLSNIFFILILLYIAIKIILGLGGSDVKKMIAKVIITALLINFSMFFTQVIIDTSNIIALIFYNKISVSTEDSNGNLVPRPYDSVGGEKDVAGGMVSAFDPTIPLKQAFFDQTAKIYYTDPKTGITTDTGQTTGEVPAGTMIALILISGLIMSFAIYALFVSGLSFLGRLMELWVLIIFSPFALMSSTVPKLAGIEYLGWDAWFKRLLKVSFMAPIFMFFLYFIFMLISSNIFKEIVKPSVSITNDPAGATKMLLGVVMPAILICILLLKATEFAKKGSGKFGEALMSGAKIAGGLALGVATGGAAIAGRATLGRAGAALAESEWAKRREREGKFGAGALRNIGKYAGAGSFDVRGVKVAGKTLAGATGMHLGEAQKGGFAERRKEQMEKRIKRAKELETGEGTKEKREASALEAQLRTAKAGKATDLAKVEKEITELRQKMQDQRAAGLEDEARATYGQLEGKQDEKRVLRGAEIKDASGAIITPRVSGGIADLEDRLNRANDKINEAEIKGMNKYAKVVESTGNKLLHTMLTLGQYSWKGADISADRIRKGVKIEETKK